MIQFSHHRPENVAGRATIFHQLYFVISWLMEEIPMIQMIYNAIDIGFDALYLSWLEIWASDGKISLNTCPTRVENQGDAKLFSNTIYSIKFSFSNTNITIS